LLISKFNYW